MTIKQLEQYKKCLLECQIKGKTFCIKQHRNWLKIMVLLQQKHCLSRTWQPRVGIGNAVLIAESEMWGWECFYKCLSTKQKKLVEVPTKTVKPSQTCPCCGKQEKKLLSTRVHKCSCGYTASRDVAAARVMLLWATNKLRITSGTGVLARDLDNQGSMTQETAPMVSKRLRAQ